MIKQLNSSNIGISNWEENGFNHADALHGWNEDDIKMRNEKHESYFLLAQEIIKQFPNVNSILELGSGNGSLSFHLRKLKPELFIITVDANIESMMSPWVLKDYHFVCRTDEKLIFDLENKTVFFDLILSFDHFEHIAQDRFGIVIDNIINHSHSNTVLYTHIANWSDGYEKFHQNVRAEDEWIQYFKSKKMKLIDKKFIRSEILPFYTKIGNQCELTFQVRGNQ